MSDLSFVLISFIIGIVAGTYPAVIGGFSSFIISKVAHTPTNNKRPLVLGSITLLYIVMTLVITSCIMSFIFNSLTTDYKQALLILIALFAIGIGLIHIYRYFWHTRLFVPIHMKQLAHKLLIKNNGITSPIGATGIILYSSALFVLTVMLCFMAVAYVLRVEPFIWTIPFALGFITPIYFIMSMLLSGTLGSKMLFWKEKTKATTGLYNGVAVIFVAWLILYSVLISGVAK